MNITKTDLLNKKNFFFDGSENGNTIHVRVFYDRVKKLFTIERDGFTISATKTYYSLNFRFGCLVQCLALRKSRVYLNERP